MYRAEAIAVTGMVLCVVAARDSGFACGYAENTGTNFNKERELTHAFIVAFKGKPCIGKKNITATLGIP